MAISAQQISTAKDISFKILSVASQMDNLLHTTKIIATNGWAAPPIPGVTTSTVYSAADQNAILAQYAALKSQLVTLFNQLP